MAFFDYQLQQPQAGLGATNPFLFQDQTCDSADDVDCVVATITQWSMQVRHVPEKNTGPANDQPVENLHSDLESDVHYSSFASFGAGLELFSEIPVLKFCIAFARSAINLNQNQSKAAFLRRRLIDRFKLISMPKSNLRMRASWLS